MRPQDWTSQKEPQSALTQAKAQTNSPTKLHVAQEAQEPINMCDTTRKRQHWQRIDHARRVGSNISPQPALTPLEAIKDGDKSAENRPNKPTKHDLIGIMGGQQTNQGGKLPEGSTGRYKRTDLKTWKSVRSETPTRAD